MNENQLFFTFFFFNDTATTEIYTLSLHDALPISDEYGIPIPVVHFRFGENDLALWRDKNRSLMEICSNLKRSEEHTSELQSRLHLVCRLLLEKKKRLNIVIYLKIGSHRTLANLLVYINHQIFLYNERKPIILYFFFF